MAYALKYDPDEESRHRIWSSIECLKTAVIGDWNGRPVAEAPLLSYADPRQGVVWLLTSKPPLPAEGIKYQRINLIYLDPMEGLHINLSGWAEFVEERAGLDTLWTAFAPFRFGGKTISALTIIKVHAERAEYSAVDNCFTDLWQRAKSKVVPYFRTWSNGAEVEL